MELQRTVSTIAGVIFAVGFAASPAVAGGAGGECPFQIEVNAIRAGARVVKTTPNHTTDVTAKARILKGTAPSGTTLQTTLTIEAVSPPGGTVRSTNATGPITLGVGKGGKGAKLELSTEICVDGFIEFVATFSGLTSANDPCEGQRILRKECT